MARFGIILGTILWCLIAAASAHAVDIGGSLTIGVTQDSLAHGSDCAKLTAPTPSDKTCHGASVQVASPARSSSTRKITNDRSVADIVHVAYQPRRRRVRANISTGPPITVEHHSRAPFWRVFAVSSRLRN